MVAFLFGLPIVGYMQDTTCNWDIQNGPIATLLLSFLMENFQIFYFHSGKQNLITPENKELSSLWTMQYSFKTAVHSAKKTKFLQYLWKNLGGIW